MTTVIGGSSPSITFSDSTTQSTAFTGLNQSASPYTTSLGYQALNSNTGTNNVAVGYQSLVSNTTASNNTAVGYQAGYSNQTGLYNTFVGYQAGYNSVGNAGTGSNSCFGILSGNQLTTGTINTFLGQSSGYYVTTGSKNTILGSYSGNQGGLDIRTSSNYIVLSDGDGNPRQFFNNSGFGYINATGVSSTSYLNIYFSRSVANGITLATDSSASTSHINFQNSASSSGGGTSVGSISTSGSSTAFNTSSDKRLKTLIGVATDTSVIDNVVVNDFTWKTDGTTDRGVFAQDVQAIKPSAVHAGQSDELNEKGFPVDPWGVDYSKFVPDLIVYCQQLKATIEVQATEIASLKAKVGV